MRTPLLLVYEEPFTTSSERFLSITNYYEDISIANILTWSFTQLHILEVTTSNLLRKLKRKIENHLFMANVTKRNSRSVRMQQKLENMKDLNEKSSKVCNLFFLYYSKLEKNKLISVLLKGCLANACTNFGF